ncbi:unnamed protein product [Protopolystoma xenopodis]|uniref:Uncharacterized protein n=1 Tax=Protopolystoma xenopodis TaxID=117903 RepID=A0A3S5AXK3_9PLAT|nr:unnamed protein product [Protopolystoma xenopodis]
MGHITHRTEAEKERHEAIVVCFNLDPHLGWSAFGHCFTHACLIRHLMKICTSRFPGWLGHIRLKLESRRDFPSIRLRLELESNWMPPFSPQSVSASSRSVTSILHFCRSNHFPFYRFQQLTQLNV